jgi:hypothetical protein
MSLIAERQKALLEAQRSREREEQIRRQRQANILGISPNDFSTAGQRLKAVMEARGKKKPTTVGTLSNTAGKGLFEVSGNVNARLAKYCNMLKMGVPRVAVEQKMRMEGMTNVSSLDKCGAKVAPVTTNTSTRKTTRNIGIGTNNFSNTNRMSNANNFSSVGSVPSVEATHYISKSKNGQVYYEPFNSSETSWNVPVGTVVRNKNGVNWKYAGKNKVSGKNYFENTSNNLSAPSRWVDDMKFYPEKANTSTVPPPPPFVFPPPPPPPPSIPPPPPLPALPSGWKARRAAASSAFGPRSVNINSVTGVNTRANNARARLDAARTQKLKNRALSQVSGLIGNAEASANAEAAKREANRLEKLTQERRNRTGKILAGRTLGLRMNRELGFGTNGQQLSQKNLNRYRYAARQGSKYSDFPGQPKRKFVPGTGSILNTNYNTNMNTRLSKNLNSKRAARNLAILSGTPSKETISQLYTYLTSQTGKTANSLNFDYNKRESFATIFYDKYQKKFRAFFKVGSELIMVESKDCNELLDKIMLSEEIVKKIISVCGQPPANTTLRDHVSKCAGVTGLRRAYPGENTRTNEQIRAAAKAEMNARAARNKTAKNARNKELAAKADNIVSKIIKQANLSAKNAKGRELIAKEVLVQALPTVSNFKTRRRVVRRVVQYIKQGVPKQPGFFGRLLGRKPTPVTNADIDLETDRLMANVEKLMAQKAQNRQTRRATRVFKP